jgi:hypothetical protein
MYLDFPSQIGLKASVSDSFIHRSSFRPLGLLLLGEVMAHRAPWSRVEGAGRTVE